MDHPNRLENMVSKYENTLFRTALAILGDRAGAEDAVQDTFLRYLEKRPNFAGEDHEKAWLLRVTANRASDLFRSPWRRRVPLEAVWEEAAPPQDGPGETVAAVLALPAKLRIVVHLFYYEELSVAQIAELLNMREGAVKTRLSRARALLRRNMLEGGENDAVG